MNAASINHQLSAINPAGSKTTVQPEARDYEIRIWYSAEAGDDCFVAQVVEWPGIMAHGETREEAARQIQLALEGALQVAAERGIKPPDPALARGECTSASGVELDEIAGGDTGRYACE
jgi:predicted RNase H-like HicB family nuclease